jgi:hypothetical protein
MPYNLPFLPGGQAVFQAYQIPDQCPHCRWTGQQVLEKSPVRTVRDADSGKDDLWAVFVCPRLACAKPYFAIFAERYEGGYALTDLTPIRPQTRSRNATVEAISKQYYEVFDEALAAEEYELTLIAGVGYRKALEFLVKDYVVRNDRKKLQEAEKGSDSQAIADANGRIDETLGAFLGDVIKKIEDSRIKAIAERAAWLGNDETHYVRKWNAHDVDDLKTLINLVEVFIISEAETERVLREMPERRR